MKTHFYVDQFSLPTSITSLVNYYIEKLLEKAFLDLKDRKETPLIVEILLGSSSSGPALFRVLSFTYQYKLEAWMKLIETEVSVSQLSRPVQEVNIRIHASAFDPVKKYFQSLTEDLHGKNDFFVSRSPGNYDVGRALAHCWTTP